MSNIPTAAALIFRFKVELYCSAHGIAVQEFDSSDPSVRALVEAHFDGRNGMPPKGHPDEYAVAFAAAYPSAAVRNDFIHEQVAAARPNFGHYTLAALMAVDLVRVVFSTNFDDLPEQAARALLDSPLVNPRRPVTVAELYSAPVALQALKNEAWPLIAKLHGDFRSERLMNIPSELREQDDDMRTALLESCRRFGLIVIGYSGRDRSVMTVLHDALREPGPFPGGLYWCYRPTDPPGEPVLALLSEARQRNVQAEAIPVDNFVELAGALERAVRFPDSVRRWLNERRPQTILHPASLPSGSTSPFPVLRLNALPVGQLPARARRLIEDHPVELAAAQQAIRSSRARALVGRRASGELVGLGNDTELNNALGPLGIRVTSELVAFGWDAPVVGSADIGLALDALTLGLGRGEGLRHVLARRGHLVRVEDGHHPALEGLRRACEGPVVGLVPRTYLSWAEAVGLTLERRNGAWWLLLTPEIWVTPRPDGPSLPGADVDWRGWPAEQQQRAADFVRERLATRYNRDTNRLLEAWVGLLARGGEPRTVHTWNLPEGSGVDPTFDLYSVTAFSRPLAAWEQSQAATLPQPETRH
jgi:SIR2-like domain